MSVVVRRGAYSARHPDSPIALGWDEAGPVRVGYRGEIAHAVSSSDLKRAYGLAVCSSTGEAVDVHQSITKLWPDLTPADYLVKWIRTALTWADAHDIGDCSVDQQEAWDAGRLADYDQVQAELAQVAPLWFTDWLDRLLHRPKIDMLIELGAHEWLNAGAPYPRDEAWAVKMGVQWRRRLQSGEQVARVIRELEVF